MSRAHDVAHATFADPERSSMRRLLEVRGLVGGHQMPHELVTLEAEDGVRIAATLLPGPVGSPAVVHAHGFGANRRKPSYAGFTDHLARGMTVLSIDLRGHGQSGGQCSLGDREVLDVRAAVRWLRAAGHDWVGGIGVSMGATSTVHALTMDDPPDAVVAISSPARLHPEPESEPMERLHQLWTSPPHRLAFRAVTGVRVVPVSKWRSPPHPEEVVPEAGVPILLVHGVDDHFFDIAQWDLVAKTHDLPLWREPAGFGHAEDGLSPQLAARIVTAVAVARAAGRFPGGEGAGQ